MIYKNDIYCYSGSSPEEFQDHTNFFKTNSHCGCELWNVGRLHAKCKYSGGHFWNTLNRQSVEYEEKSDKLRQFIWWFQNLFETRKNKEWLVQNYRQIIKHYLTSLIKNILKIMILILLQTLVCISNNMFCLA